MTAKLLTEHHLEFLTLEGGCTGSSESTHVKMPHCWKSHVTAHFSHFYCVTREALQTHWEHVSREGDITLLVLYQQLLKGCISFLQSLQKDIHLSHDLASGSDIMPCNKIDKPLVVYRFCYVTL